MERAYSPSGRTDLAQVGFRVANCSCSPSSSRLLAIIGLFLLTGVDSIEGIVLTFSASVLAILVLCAHSLVLLLTFSATEPAGKQPFS